MSQEDSSDDSSDEMEALNNRYRREQVERTRGIVSSKCQIRVQRGEQIEEEEEDEDPEAYKYPKIKHDTPRHLQTQGGSTQIFDLEENEDEDQEKESDRDLESQTFFNPQRQKQ